MKFYILAILIGVDQLANAILGPLLNLLLQTPIEARFGSPDETLSSVFGKNVRLNRCVLCKGICWLLDRIDWTTDQHCIDAIEEDEHGLGL